MRLTAPATQNCQQHLYIHLPFLYKRGDNVFHRKMIAKKAKHARSKNAVPLSSAKTEGGEKTSTSPDRPLCEAAENHWRQKYCKTGHASPSVGLFNSYASRHHNTKNTTPSWTSKLPVNSPPILESTGPIPIDPTRAFKLFPRHRANSPRAPCPTPVSQTKSYP